MSDTELLPKSKAEPVRRLEVFTGAGRRREWSTEALEIDAAFLVMAQLRPGAALIAADGFYTSQRHQIVALAGRQAFPTMYSQREFPAVGGLLSYGISYPNVYRQVGLYAVAIANQDHGCVPMAVAARLPGGRH
jgi:hypothetical protein